MAPAEGRVALGLRDEEFDGSVEGGAEDIVDAGEVVGAGGADAEGHIGREGSRLEAGGWRLVSTGSEGGTSGKTLLSTVFDPL
jgi:hypothetical protein